MKPKTPIRFAVALLKHAVTKTLGEDALAVLANESLGEMQERLDAWLEDEENKQALSAAMEQADVCFGQRSQDPRLQQWMHELPMCDLPALQKELDALPEQANEDKLEEAIRTAMARDWPALSHEQIAGAVRLYLFCLRQALLPLEEQSLTVIGRSVLRTEGRVEQLQNQIEAWMAQERERCDRGVSIYGNVYQSIIVSGDRNVIHYNVYYVGGMWEMVDQLLVGPPPLLPQEKSYLRLLRAKSDRVRLAEDDPGTEKDRQEQESRVELHRVYVDLAVETPAPTVEDVFDRLEVPFDERLSLREAMNAWLMHRAPEDARRLNVDEVKDYGALLIQLAGKKEDDWKRHPLSRWATDEETLTSALAPLTAVEALDRHRILVLLGNPGSGKSTFVNYLAYILAGAFLEEEPQWREMLERQFEAPLFPLRVVIRRWSSSLRSKANPDTGEEVDKPDVELVYRALEKELRGGVDRQNLIRRLDHPDTLVMFDGLDEAPIPERSTDFNHRKVILDSIREFRLAHPNCRVLVTSRIRPYNNPSYRLSDFPDATLAPLDDPRIERFVNQWYEEMLRVGEIVQRDKAEKKQRQLLGAIARRPNLRDMAGTPLLLTMLAMVNTHSELPERRVELYHLVVQQLLWEWDKRKSEEGNVSSLRFFLGAPEPPIDKSEFEKMLWELTYQAHAQSGKEKAAAIHTADLRKALVNLYAQKGRSPFEGEAWAARVIALMQERSGLLIPDEDDTFIFPHRSFQEYLAARWLVTLKNPAKTFLTLVENDIWHEVILLACGYLTIKDVQFQGFWYSIVSRLARGMKSDLRRWQAPVLAGMAWLEYGYDELDEEDAGMLLEHLEPALTQIMQTTELPMPYRPMEEEVDMEKAVARSRLEAGLLLADLGVLPDDLDALIPVSSGKLGYNFRMGKYPVTNAQYRHFFDAGGYDGDRPWWTEEINRELAWDENWRKGPRYWGNSRYDRATQPVVGVSWYEAWAYCRWLSEVWRAEGVIGEDEQVRLPKEAEWEAAGGEGKYTWGDDFNPAHCNSKESEFDQPSPVHMYPSGATPSGIHDLCGNVWEWSLDDHESWGKVIRSGAFWNDAESVTLAARDWYLPHAWIDVDVGFRVVVVPISRSS